MKSVFAYILTTDKASSWNFTEISSRWNIT